MKKSIKTLLLAMMILPLCSNFAYAQDSLTTTAINKTDISAQTPTASIVEVSNKSTPYLVAPVVEVPKTEKKAEAKKLNLKAVIFDPNADFKAQAAEENREMTKMEKAEENIHEALHGEVSAVSTKGFLADTMKMTFEKGPIESISPWVDYNGTFTQSWSGPTYKNDTYGINFADVGINGAMRDGKTAFRLMISPVRYIEGNTYMQSFFADNYITRKIGKHHTVLLGNTWVPNGIESKESPLTIPFFARSQISRTYGTSRAIGAKVMGDYDLIEYQLGGYSSERFFKDFFPGPEFAGIVSLKPLGKTNGKYGKITMGGSMDAGNSNSHFCVNGAHLIYDYKRFKASFEYATADGSNGSTGFSPNSSEGYYGTLAYRVTPKLQLLARYDRFDPNKNKANDMRTEYTAGMNYFIKGQSVKLMVNFVYYTLENGTYGSRIMTGTQFIL